MRGVQCDLFPGAAYCCKCWPFYDVFILYVFGWSGWIGQLKLQLCYKNNHWMWVLAYCGCTFILAEVIRLFVSQRINSKDPVWDLSYLVGWFLRTESQSAKWFALTLHEVRHSSASGADQHLHRSAIWCPNMACASGLCMAPRKDRCMAVRGGLIERGIFFQRFHNIR